MMRTDQPSRRLPVGAQLLSNGEVHVRVWAPRRRQVEVVLEDQTGKNSPADSRTRSLAAEENGYFSGGLAEVPAGSLYRFRLDGGPELYPDPASRYQPQGPHGPSQVVDPQEFAWTDQSWRGVRQTGEVIYELHIGTFTREGTW